MTLKAIPGGEGVPPTPDWSQTFVDVLDLAFAHEEWTAVVNEMSGRGILSVANGHAIKRLVEFRVQYERAARQLAEQGPIIRAKRIGVAQSGLFGDPAHVHVTRRRDCYAPRDRSLQEFSIRKATIRSELIAALEVGSLITS